MTHDLRTAFPRWAALAAVLIGVGMAPPAIGAPATPPWASAATPLIEGSAARVVAADATRSRDALFDADDKPRARPDGPREAREGLFETDTPREAAWSGFVRGEVARTFASPAHWSKLLIRSELAGRGTLSPGVRYRIGARVDYDFVYDATDFYPPEVRRDQRFNVLLRENYLDFGAGDWDFRIGRQHIVWGEMVGLFFADVVSAKDLREFILPDFDVLRIPQWAARAEYSRDDFHAELIWIPVSSYDEIGKPGAEFFPAVLPPPPGFATLFDSEQFPQRKLANSNYGMRLSMLQHGWDVSGFYYRSLDAQPTFYRRTVLAPQPAFIYQARHDRIDQVGGTLAKDFGGAVLKAETVYTRGRRYGVRRPDDDGVVTQNTLDLVVGIDFMPTSRTRVDLQAFNRVFFSHDPDIVFKRNEPGVTLLVNHELTDRLHAELLTISMLNRSDWMARPRLLWNFQPNWQLILGVDIFKGPPLGLFGQFDHRDRVYTEIRYSF